MSDMLKHLSYFPKHGVTTMPTSRNYSKNRERLYTNIPLLLQFHSKPASMVVSCVAVCVLCTNVNHEESNLEIPLGCVCACVLLCVIEAV